MTKRCPNCEAMLRRLQTSEFHYDRVLANLPQVHRDRLAVISQIARLCQWAKNAESDRTAVAKAEQEVTALIYGYDKKSKAARRGLRWSGETSRGGGSSRRPRRRSSTR